MATMTIDGMDDLVSTLDRVESQMKRAGIRRIVEAGANAAAEEMGQGIQRYHHVRTGSMLQNVGGAEYKETFEGGSMNVYPLGNDSRGVSNAMKAYVINYGRGRNPTRHGKANRTGDKFITGNFRKSEEKAKAAMAAEASAFLSNVLNQGG